VGRLLLADQAIALSVFPNDDRLGALRLLADTVSRERLLRELLPDRPEWWSSGVARLRYKPERRYVAQLRGAGPNAVLRIYEEARFSAAQRGAGALSSTGRLRLPRPWVASAEHRLLVYEWLPGRPLNELIAEPDLDPRAIAAVGAALAEWHRQTGAPLACRSHEVEATALAAAVRGVAAVCPHLQPRARALAERLAALLARPPARYCPIHGDFYADQVLLAGDEVAILDLDNAALGDPAVDLGNFAAHLENDALHGRLDARRVKLLQNALLEGYRASTQRPVPVTFWWHTAAGLLRLAPHPFRRRVPDWPERTAAILNRVETILDLYCEGDPCHTGGAAVSVLSGQLSASERRG
jgi:aminoglycoside phosphotransferase (APT) family kinase protein